MENFLLEKIINQKLLSDQYNDIVPNGLQIEGEKKINKIITGVTACQDLLDKAVLYKANTIIVHHGYFWKNESQYIHNMKRNRLKTILSNNINLYSWHLPLDAHPQLGNNVQIAKKLDISIKGNITPYVFWGILKEHINIFDFSKKIEEKFKRKPTYICKNTSKNISRLAWCSGKGQNFIKQAYDFGVDTFLTGEISEETTHIAKELGINFFSMGHHATEKDGIKSLGEWLHNKYDLDVNFIDIENPA
ncbi:Nif3-like dinuclear metal center hexameric protein [Buchnera aphidicola]|uniref:Nif3-like dinuclear metal center hexameric protein n=1 Tax=Buchnera aphidicola TaxID=9 RepID=UPI0034644729